MPLVRAQEGLCRKGGRAGRKDQEKEGRRMWMEISLGQARRFVLLQQGLLGGYRYAGKQGALDFVRHAGCIQFDPVDVCGKMAELTLQSRVKGFSKQQLNELLYEDRRLFDYPDKQLSILPTENWPYYGRISGAGQARRGEVRGHGPLGGTRRWPIFGKRGPFAPRSCRCPASCFGIPTSIGAAIGTGSPGLPARCSSSCTPRASW